MYVGLAMGIVSVYDIKPL